MDNFGKMARLGFMGLKRIKLLSSTIGKYHSSHTSDILLNWYIDSLVHFPVAGESLYKTYLVSIVSPRTNSYGADLLIKRKVLIYHEAEGVYAGSRYPQHGSIISNYDFGVHEFCIPEAARFNRIN